MRWSIVAEKVTFARPVARFFSPQVPGPKRNIRPVSGFLRNAVNHPPVASVSLIDTASDAMRSRSRMCDNTR